MESVWLIKNKNHFLLRFSLTVETALHSDRKIYHPILTINKRFIGSSIVTFLCAIMPCQLTFCYNSSHRYLIYKENTIDLAHYWVRHGSKLVRDAQVFRWIIAPYPPHLIQEAFVVGVHIKVAMSNETLTKHTKAWKFSQLCIIK